MATEIRIIGLDELKAAIKRSPTTVLNETRKFISQGLAIYKRGINNQPWRVGGTGGGAPVSNDPRYPRKNQRSRSGNLRDTHRTNISNLEGRIFPTAPYAIWVHNGTRRMKARPWLDYVKSTQDREIQKLYRGMLETITKDLAK